MSYFCFEMGAYEGHVLNDILNTVSSATIMVINLKKNSFYSFGLERNLLDRLQRLFNISLQEIQGGLKYTGYNLKENCYRKTDWSWHIS